VEPPTNQIHGLGHPDLPFTTPRGRLHYSDLGNVAGLQTIRRLDESGIWTLAELATKGEEDLVRLGVQRRFAVQILAYMRRRLK
jgi:hypothetical protein